MEAEYNAGTCVALYMLLMSFSQKGIDKLSNFQEHMKMRHPDGDFVVSEGFDDGSFFYLPSSGTWGRCIGHVDLILCFSPLALNWFKDHFIKCNDRAALVKTWLPVTYDGPKTWLDQLVYDHALIQVSHQCLLAVERSTYVSMQSRTAARKELLDQMVTPDECEKLYEESLWCLYALQDDLLQTGNPFMDEDRETIATCGWFLPSFYPIAV